MTLWILIVAGVLSTDDVPRVLRAPMYLTRLPLVLAEVAIWGVEMTVARRIIDLLAMPLMLAPYILLDLGLQRLKSLWRLSRGARTARQRPVV